jgi:hypothetical protein
MRLVERHVIDKNHRFSKECDDLAGRSKNLYNYCNYLIRQSFIGQDTYLDNCQIYHEVKSHEAYKALPAKVSNQVLISLHRKLIYKAELVGIRVIITEESYTSKSSFLDYDPIPTYGQKDDPIKFSGSRIKRGLYKSANGTIINADVNGSYNILRKVFPTAIKPRDSGCAVRPIRIAPNEVKKASQDICPCFG